MRAYSYELSNNHYIVDIDGKKYLIDTGLGWSFWTYKPIDSVKIDGKSFHLMSKPYNLDLAKTEKLVGLKVDGFIGLDIIRETSLTVYKNNILVFEAMAIEDGKVIPLSFDDSISFKIKYDDNIMRKFVIDTGAKFGYGLGNLFAGKQPFAHVDDYNPILGDLDSDIYHLTINVAGENKMIDICSNYKVEQILTKHLHASMVGNITTLFNEACVIDIKNRKLVLR